MRLYDQPEVEVLALCHDCRKQHTYRVSASDLDRVQSEWEVKHRGHPITFSRPRPIYGTALRKWLADFWRDCPIWAPVGYDHNADVKGAYVASAAYAITLASLASSSTFTAGRESTAINNTATKYLDFIVAGKVTTGTTPTVSKQINVYAYAAQNDTPTYQDVFDGTDSAETVTSANVLASVCVPLKAMVVDATSDRTYPMIGVSLAAFFGTLMPPDYHGLFVAHDTVAALNATGSNHAFDYTGLYATVA